MNGALLPSVGEQVEVSVSDERSYTTWVDAVEGDVLSVFTPHDVLVGDLPDVGTPVMLRWHSHRGRHFVDAAFVGTHDDGGRQWVLELDSSVRIAQDRRYVRGAGGEVLTLSRAEPALGPVEGVAVDLSEGGLRGAFDPASVADVAEDDVLAVDVLLDGQAVGLTATVLRVLPQPDRTDVVVVYEPDDRTATRIRRHVLEAQRLARQAARDE